SPHAHIARRQQSRSLHSRAHVHLSLFSLITRHPLSPLFPYTTLFRSPLLEENPVVFPQTINPPSSTRSIPFAYSVPVVPNVIDLDRKSTRLNSSHDQISYAVFCLKKKSRRAPLAGQQGKLKTGGVYQM